MGNMGDREFNLDGWGDEKRLIEGTCGHCHHAVAFKDPKSRTCQVFTQMIRLEADIVEERTHYFVMGICPRPRCQEATIVYRSEGVIVTDGYRQDPELIEERIIFPTSTLRPDLALEIPEPLRALFREAASIENLSPNGSAFLTRRILEQTLRDYFRKPKGNLANLIADFLEIDDTPKTLNIMMEDIRQFGNIAGHPLQDCTGQWTNVDPIEASYTLNVVSEVLDYIYVKPVTRQQMQERWQAKKRGEVPPDQPCNQILLGGCDKHPKPVNTEDDLPF